MVLVLPVVGFLLELFILLAEILNDVVFIHG